MDIFCENNHLVLRQDRCPVCGWLRPAAGDGGALTWGTIRLPGTLGQPGIATPAVLKKTAIFPLTSGSIIGLNIQDGGIRWQVELGQGLFCQDIRADGDTFLCAISDVRLPGQSGKGFLARIKPENGRITPVWQADTSRISNFALTEDRIYIRSARPELYAFTREDNPNVLWKTGLESWSLTPPLVVNELIVIPDGQISSDYGHFKLIQTIDGQTTRHSYMTSSLLQLPLTEHQGLMFFRHGSKRLVALDPTRTEPRWSQEFDKIYTDAAAGNGNVYIAARRPNADGTGHEYRLVCLEAATGQICWENTLEERVSLTPAFHHNLVLVGGEKGGIFAFDGITGKALWQNRIGDDGSPILTRLECTDDLLIAGTHNGEVGALALGLAGGDDTSPEDLLDKGLYEQAATAFALEEKYAEAARIFSEDLKEPEKALALLEFAGLHKEAGELAQNLNFNTLALNYYRTAGDAHAEALVLIRMGDTLKAAQLLEEIGELAQAAALYEKSDEPRKAIDIYKRLDQLTAVARLSELVSGTDEDIDFLVTAGRVKEAARVAERNSRFRKAVELYRMAQAVDEEYRILQLLAEEQPEEWSLERLTALAAIKNDHIIAANAWEKLERPRHAAAAYRKAAEEREAQQPENASGIADLYELAMQRYAEAGLSNEREACYGKVILYRELPYIVVRATMDDKFREDEINEVKLDIENTGSGRALDVQVHIGGDRFEVDEKTGVQKIERLGVQASEQRTTYLRPKLRQYGNAVPLQLSWAWSDGKGNQYQNQVTKSVAVRRQDDSDVSRPGEIALGPTEMATSQAISMASLPKAADLVPPPRKVKLLILAANPSNLDMLKLGEELRAIQNVVATIPKDHEIDIEYRPAVQARDLQGLLLSEKPDIVHFSGHGSPSGSIYVQDASGDGHPLSAKALSDLFGLLQGNIRLVVLNACYSETQAQAIAQHIDCVVGMSSEIEDDAARAFSEALYRGIGYGTDLETAFNLGCNAIDMENLDDVMVPKILAPRTQASRVCFFPS